MQEYLSAMMVGAGNLLSWPNILIPIMGTLIAMFSAFLPGIGGTSIAAIMLLLTLNWDPVQVLLLFGALTGGATYMGSITAILFNIPGNASSAAAMIDGHVMARNGLPRTAIAAAATASAVGSVIGVIVLIALLPIIRPFILQFGPLERFLLGLWGLTTIAAIPNRSTIRSLAAASIGLLMAMIGSDPTDGTPRWTFGNLNLYDGFDTIVVLLGFFTLSEVMAWRGRFSLSGVHSSKDQVDSTAAGIISVFKNFRVTMRSSILGTVIGIIPGIGGTVASFVAYGQTVQATKGDKSSFGKGDIRGLIAPEAAVDAKDGGSLLPTLAFGLPGSEAGVILLSVLMIHGFVPGLPMLTTELSFSFTLIMSLLLSNLLTSAVGLSLAPYLARLTNLRIDRIVLPILVVSLVTIIQLNGALTDIYIALGFGILGYLFNLFDWPRIPFVIAFVLGSFIENNFALVIEMQKVGRLNIFERAAALGIGLLILISFIFMLRKSNSGADLEKRSKDHSAQGMSVLFSITLGIISLILLGEAATSSYKYTAFSLIVAISTIILCSIAAVQNFRAASRTAHTQRWIIPIPVEHQLPFLLMLFIGPTIFIIGLPIALGLFVTAWVLNWQSLDRVDILRSVAFGIFTSYLSLLYLNKVIEIELPPPAVYVFVSNVFGG